MTIFCFGDNSFSNARICSERSSFDFDIYSTLNNSSDGKNIISASFKNELNPS